MNAELETLARRAVACRHFQWIEGMQAFVTKGSIVSNPIDPNSKFRVACVAIMILDIHPDDLPEKRNKGNKRKQEVLMTNYCPIHNKIAFPNCCYPDLIDPATIGCLLTVVREAWGKLELYCAAAGEGKWVVKVSEDKRFTGDSEAEALVAALEAAP